MMQSQPVFTPCAPLPIGPYSQAIQVGGMIFVSGQIALDPATGDLVGGSFDDECRQVINNLGAVLSASGASFHDVVKTTIYVTDLADFGRLNAVYGEVFGHTKPARATVQVAALPKGARVEIEAVAAR